MKRLLLICIAAFSGLLSNAQLLTWTPSFPTENDSLLITVDATKGNAGLLNYTPATDVYVHVGVITNLSTSSSDWRHAPFAWATTTTAAHANYIGNNKWTFTIKPDLRTFFGITDPAEKIQKVAILFRTGDGNIKQANADLSDMYIPVYTGAFSVRIDQPFSQPKYTRVPEPQNLVIGNSFSITANSSKPATLTLYHNSAQISGPTTNVQSLTGSSTITAAGNQQLVVAANDGTTTVYDTLSFFVAPSGSTIADLPAGVRDGINYQPGDTTAILVLRAPGKNIITVIGDFNNWTQTVNYVMNKTPDGKFFWLRLHNLVPSTEYAYQYQVDDSIKIADPYTEKILDPDNDQFISSATYPGLKQYPSGKTTGIVSLLQTGATTYNWSTNNYVRPDKKGLVIYELLVRDFIAKHDWQTLKDSLNYFRKLGINAIELMPVNEFEGNDSWGYNPDFYLAPDKYYGTKNALKEFIDSCHKSGIAVIMDIALNHSFGSSPMVQLYFDKQANRPAANNPWFNPVAKHAFNVGYDMNHESADTKYFVSRVVENWLQQYKIDGFRFDLAKGFTQKQTCDGNGNNCDVGAWGNYDPSRVAIWKGYYDTVQSKSANAYTILEYFAGNVEEKELADYGMMLWGNMNANYAQAALGYATPDPGNNPPDFSYGIYTNRAWTKPHLVTYMESHDEERIMYKNEQYGNSAGSYNVKDIATGLKRVELDAAFFYTIPGPKMLWQFGELGYDYSINACTDGTVNNNCRLADKPIRWDYLSVPERKHVHDVFSSLIQLRFHPLYKDLFITGTVSSSLDQVGKWLIVRSVSDTSDLVSIGNFDVNNQTVNVTFPTAGTWYNYLTNETISATGSVQSLNLAPGEYSVFINRNLNGTSITPVPPVDTLVGSQLEARVFPNPATTNFTLELKVPSNDNFNIELYNGMGQHISTLYSGNLLKGVHPLSIPKQYGSSGNYYIRILSKTATRTLKLTIQ